MSRKPQPQRFAERLRLAASVLAALLVALPASADEVLLKNGDKVSGTVVRLHKGSLVLRTEYGGDISINLKHVRTFSTNSPISVELKDGTRMKSSVAAADPDTIDIKPPASPTKTRVKLSDLDAYERPIQHPYGLSGRAGLGFTETQDKTNHQSLALSGDLDYRAGPGTLHAYGDWHYGTVEEKKKKPERTVTITTANNVDTGLEYDFHLDDWKRWFFWGAGEMKRDPVNLSDFLIRSGGGAGVLLFQTKRVEGNFQFGVENVNQQFTNATRGYDTAAAPLEFKFEAWLTRRSRIQNRFAYVPSLQDSNLYLISNHASFTTMLNRRLAFDAKVRFDYTHKAAPTSQHGTAKYFVGLSYLF